MSPRKAAAEPGADGFPHRFTGAVARLRMGSMAFTCVYLPEELERALPFDRHPRLRIEALVAGKPLNGALQPSGGRHFLMLSRRVLAERRLVLGATVEVAFRIADQDAVEMPAELERALAKNPSARREWEKMTPGKRRGLAYHIAAAKTAPTRAKRVDLVLGMLQPHRFPSPFDDD
ncbi:MAG: YdeI/OmpD-associated family protein [Candidatus Sumerlaeia bacterium]|nr:YdeI/OmpD-associated family protein [Candidatus Sumerlaeia bacterium]